MDFGAIPKCIFVVYFELIPERYLYTYILYCAGCNEVTL